MVSNKVYQAPDYFSFIQDISKQWTKEKNNDIAFEFGLDKSVLPALVTLSRAWNIAFDSIREDVNQKEKHISSLNQEIKNLKKQIEDLKTVDTQIIIEDLKNQIEDLKNQRNEAEESFFKLREEMCEMTPKKTFFGIG